MSEADEGRDHEPTARKLEEARAKGDIPRSADLTAAAAMAGLMLTVMVGGAGIITTFGDRGEAFLGQADRLDRGMAMAGPGLVAGWVAALIGPLLPLMILPGVAALLALLGQRGLVFSGEKIAPKLSRIDPLANAKQKFGGQGLFEFAKSALKLLAVSLLLGAFLWHGLADLVILLERDALPAGAEMFRMLMSFLLLTLAIGLVFGTLDFGWQYFAHLRRNRMTRQELVDEFKQSEGDPHMKSHRRQRAQEIAMNRMLADVPKADVVIVNPTHYAVALKWDRARGRAPHCLAKGADEIAARIREAAQAAGVPIHSDPPTARALYATIEVGAEIRTEHYAPVAAAIRYAERMRKRARERGTVAI